jgi:hypothetical protein
MSEEFRADEVFCETDRFNGDVRMTFRQDKGGALAAILPQGALLSLLADLQARVQSGAVRPLAKAGLPLGGTFRLHGITVSARAEGGALLTLLVNVEDGVRTLPIELPVDDLKSLHTQLGRHL